MPPTSTITRRGGPSLTASTASAAALRRDVCSEQPMITANSSKGIERRSIVCLDEGEWDRGGRVGWELSHIASPLSAKGRLRLRSGVVLGGLPCTTHTHQNSATIGAWSDALPL